MTDSGIRLGRSRTDNGGYSHTCEAKAKIAASKVGARNPRYGKTEGQSPRWKGDAVGYAGIHDWMTSRYGQPKHCDECKTTDPAKRYEWANISGEYRRDRADFRRLCKKCHTDFDGVNAHEVGSPPRKNRPMSAIRGKPVSSRFKGVRASGHGTWRATLKSGGKILNLGSFKTEEAAARAYNHAVEEIHGSDAYVNEIA